MKKSFTLATFTMATSICLLSGIACSTENFAHASSVSVEDMKAYLTSISIPKLFLELASDELVEQKYNEYKEEEEVTVNVSTSYMSENIPGGVTPLNPIPSDELEFSIFQFTTTAYDADRVKRHISKIEIYVTYEWKKLPLFKKTDAIAVNWDSSVFTYRSGTFHAIETRILDVGTIIHKDEVKRESTTPGALVQGGLGYEMALNVPEIQDDAISLSGIRGSISFYLGPTQNPIYPAHEDTDSHRETTINAQYCHNRNPFVLSVGLSKSGPSISFGTSFATDTTASSQTIFYKF